MPFLSFFSCLPKAGDRVKLEKTQVSVDEKVLPPSEVDFETDEQSQKLRKSSDQSQETDFTLSHSLPSGRDGSRLNMEAIHAEAFVEALFKDKDQLYKQELTDKLLEIGFSKEAAPAFSEILAQFLLTSERETFKEDGLKLFFLYYFDHARNSKNAYEFGFNLADQNSDGAVSKTELQRLILLFWNRKLNNALSMDCGFEAFQEYAKKTMIDEELEFYLLMKRVLSKPYMKLSTFEEIKEQYIVEDCAKQVNISDANRNEVLEYVEKSNARKLGKVKTIALKNAAEDVCNLVSIDKFFSFYNSMCTNSEISNKIFEQCGIETMDLPTFKDFLKHNEALKDFLGDARKLFRKASKIGKQKMNDMEW